MFCPYVGWNSSVSIATCYGMDGPGFELRREAWFFAPHQTGPEAHPASCAMGTASFPGVKRPGHGLNHSPLSSDEVEERVELQPYSPSGPSLPVILWILPLPTGIIFLSNFKASQPIIVNVLYTKFHGNPSSRSHDDTAGRHNETNSRFSLYMRKLLKPIYYSSQYLTNLMHKISFTISFYFMPLHVSSTCARNM